MQIELQDIHKHYGRVKANNGVSFCVASGSIHGVLGENGAGKSTLMKILAGYIPKTSGQIIVDKKPAEYSTPGEASALGIGMLYQDPLDFPRLSVLENFMLGQVHGFSMSRRHFAEKLRQLADHLEFDLDFSAPAGRLTVGERQQLEILRLLALGTRLLILDEPTTGISGLQKAALFHALKKLTSEGKSVLLVSHKLEDVSALCDRITVLRQGTVSGGMDAPFETRKVLGMMFGTPPEPPPRTGFPPGEDVLEMKDVAAPGGRTGLKNCNVAIRRGEVIGLAGLEGSGQGVFLRVAGGLTQPTAGEMRFRNARMNGRSHHAFRHAGVNFLPTDRLEEGLIPGMTITEHMALRNRQRRWLVGWSEAYQTAEQNIENFRVRGTPESAVESLSGGNQQRLMLSFLSRRPRLLLLENPTRGLDLESARWVWQYLQNYCKDGTSVIFSSAELDEILMVADRVLVFFDGHIIRDVQADQTDVNDLGRAIAGKV